MADPKHLEILEKGVEAWNEWRNNNLNIKPDLRGAFLSEAYLSGAYLGKADLTGADLWEANLRGANLREANLREADLGRANLREAYLREADLREADLGRANLREADLRGANVSNALVANTLFENTNLAQSNFRDSIFFNTIISNCDLSDILELDSVRHMGPSSIGIDTIFKSKGKIPISFLKGCGIPENVIKTLLKFARERAFEFYSSFISFTKKDEIFAEKLKKDLERNNVPCWYFPKDAVWGRDLEENIDRAIRDYDRLIIVCSENSLNSEPVLREIDRALQKEKLLKKKYKKTRRILFPIVIDDYLYEKWNHYLKPLMIRIVYGDFRNWKTPVKYKEALNKLLEGLQKE